MRHHRDNAAAGPVQGTVNRTIDLLPTTLRVIELVHGENLSDVEADLLLRLQLGIPEDITELGVLFGDRLTRPQYLALGEAGIASAEAAASEPGRVAEVLGVDADTAEALTGPAAAAA